jgi:ribose/xylose/arabinose/galactoside ABC-type transport system permease subunit
MSGRFVSRLRHAPRVWTIGTILILEMVVLTILSDNFLTVTNLTNVTRQSALIGITAVGMTFVILLAGIDLSVGSVVGLSAMASALVIRNTGIEQLGIPVAVATGALCGVVTGLMVAKLKIQPLIATLVMLSVLKSITLMLSDGSPVPLDSALIRTIGTGRTLGIPYPAWLFLVVVLIAHWVLAHTVFGRRLYAVGGAPDAASAAGIRVDLYRFSAYAIAGFLAGVASIVGAGRLGTATPLLGEGLELDVIAAVIVGGTSLFGGIGSVWGSFVGVFILAFLRNGMVLLGVDAFWQLFATGVVVLLAVLLDQFLSRVSGIRPEV